MVSARGRVGIPFAQRPPIAFYPVGRPSLALTEPCRRDVLLKNVGVEGVGRGFHDCVSELDDSRRDLVDGHPTGENSGVAIRSKFADRSVRDGRKLEGPVKSVSGNVQWLVRNDVSRGLISVKPREMAVKPLYIAFFDIRRADAIGSPERPDFGVQRRA